MKRLCLGELIVFKKVEYISRIGIVKGKDQIALDNFLPDDYEPESNEVTTDAAEPVTYGFMVKNKFPRNYLLTGTNYDKVKSERDKLEEDINKYHVERSKMNFYQRMFG